MAQPRNGLHAHRYPSTSLDQHSFMEATDQFYYSIFATYPFQVLLPSIGVRFLAGPVELLCTACATTTPAADCFAFLEFGSTSTEAGSQIGVFAAFSFQVTFATIRVWSVACPRELLSTASTIITPGFDLFTFIEFPCTAKAGSNIGVIAADRFQIFFTSITISFFARPLQFTCTACTTTPMGDLGAFQKC